MAIALASALAYLGLLVVLLLQLRRPSAAEWWLAAYCGWSAVLAGALAADSAGIVPLNLAPGFWLVAASLGSICLLGALTFSYLELKRPWLLPAAFLPAVGVIMVMDLLDRGAGLGDLSWRAALTQSFSVAALIAAVLWMSGGFGLLAITFQSLSRARLPLHANRYLWWLAVVPVIMLGEASAAWGGDLLAYIGQGVRLLGVIGAAYGVVTTHLVDVRGLLRAGAGNAVFVAATALTTLLGIGASLLLLETLPGLQGPLAVALLALLLALLHQAMRSLLGQLIEATVMHAGYDTAQTAADYSKRVAQILDVSELAAAAGRTLNRIIGVTKSGLLLITPENNLIRADVFAGSGQMPLASHHLGASSVFLNHLTYTRRPLMQYTIDVDERFGGMAPGERRWLQKLGADVYVPIFDGGTLDGILAIGPRRSGDPYRERELQLFSAIADQTSVALKNARLVTNLRALNADMRVLNETLESRNEQLRELDKVKTDFITIASHELRTPLTQMLGFADVLHMMSDRESISGADISPITSSISAAAHRLNEVIMQMLEVSELDVEALPLKFSETTVDAILRAAVEPLAPAIRERRLTFTVHGARGLPPLRGDAERLAQAFGHLIGNAIKFTPDGGHIDVHGKHLPRTGEQIDSVGVVVADTGVGINPKYHQLIFEKFFRIGSTALHSTGTTKFLGAGPGLGLPIAKAIVEGHGGRIWAESPGFDSEACPGTSIHVVLPLNPPPFTGKGASDFMKTDAGDKNS